MSPLGPLPRGRHWLLWIVFLLSQTHSFAEFFWLMFTGAMKNSLNVSKSHLRTPHFLNFPGLGVEKWHLMGYVLKKEPPTNYSICSNSNYIDTINNEHSIVRLQSAKLC
jgi:hypothetical protein